MPSHSLLVLALASAAMLAGCGGYLGTDPSQTSTPKITAAPVPTDIPTPDRSVRKVPGLSEHGVANPFELGRTHRAVLSNQSYTQQTNETTRFANDSLRLQTTTVVRVVQADDGTRTLRETAYDGPVSPAATPFSTAARIESYADERAHVRVTFRNGTTAVQSFDRTGVQSHTLELVFSAFETRIAGTIECGNRTCYVVRSSLLDSPGSLADALVRVEGGNVRNGSLLALVDERGLVHEYQVRYTVETPSHTYTAVRRVHYTALGETVVERPDWV